MRGRWRPGTMACAAARLLVAAAPLASCASLDAKVAEGRKALQLKGPIAGHVSADALAGTTDSPLFHVGVLGDSARPGEAASVDLGPVLGLGAGASGVRLTLLGLELALGTGASPPKLPPLNHKGETR